MTTSLRFDRAALALGVAYSRVSRPLRRGDWVAVDHALAALIEAALAARAALPDPLRPADEVGR